MAIQRFENAMNKLIKAFFDGTLMKGNCKACAVGNICDNREAWAALFATGGNSQQNNISGGITDWGSAKVGQFNRKYSYAFDLRQDAFKLIEETGYSAEELARVEYAFESNTELGGAFHDANRYIEIHTDEEIAEEFNLTKEGLKNLVVEDQFNGLCAVVDVLCEIEGIKDPQQYKNVFKEKPELQTS